MKGLFISFVFLFYLGQSASAETLYLTFVPKTPGETIEQKDVSLKMDKTDLPITDFFKVDTAQRTPLVLLHPAGRRHYLFIYDLVNNKPEDVLAARKKTVEILEKLGKQDLVAFAGINRKSRLVFYGNFTADNDKWLWSLNMIGRDTREGLLQGPDGNYYSAQFSATHTPVEMLSDDAFVRNVQAFAPDDKKKDETRNAYVQGLVELAYALATVKGRKDVILFSPGFDTKNVSLNLEQAQAPPAQAPSGEMEHQEFEDVVSGQSGGGMEEEGEVRRPRQMDRGINVLTDLFEGADSHVFIYGSQENEFYKDLSGRTGGFYFNPSAGASGDVDQIIASDQTYFVIGWKAGARTLARTPQPVRIETASHKISAPLEWLGPKPYNAYSALEKKMHVATAIYADEETSIKDARFWRDIVYEDGIAKIPVFLEVPGAEFLKSTAPKLPLDFYGFSISPSGAVLDYYESLAELDLTNSDLRTRLQKSGIRVWNILWGNKERLSIRWVVVNADTGETLTHSESLQLKDSELMLSSPFFPSVDFSWVVWPKLDVQTTKRGIAFHYPYAIGTDFFVPDLSPKISKDDKGRVFYFKIYNMLPGSKNPPVRLSLIDGQGNHSDIVSFGLRQEPKAVEHGGLEVFWRILAFPDVPAGQYRFEVNVTDSSRKAVVIRAVDMELL